ncbi:MAG TPA: hypothetical protein VNI77_04375 [Nitrososphaera sp.]|nr:hypothetical protein [Nitrososphaera sp.]
MLFKVIAIAAAAVTIAVGIVIFLMSTNASPGVPNVRFTDFTADRIDIRVGQATNIVFNVQNLEDRAITDGRVVITIEPSGYQPYLSIDRPSVDLPDMLSKDARTGQMHVTITANGAPAKEALYTVKGVLMVEGIQSDVREFELRVRQ